MHTTDYSRVSIGELAEWLNAPVLKTGERESVPRVRIPGSPPNTHKKRARENLALFLCVFFSRW